MDVTFISPARGWAVRAGRSPRTRR
jgi:hypothetical protein